MVSVCIIMKNEEKYIGECLKRIVVSGWEIVVVDTGSTDSSKEIALKYTDKVYDFKWINDFSAARNFAAQKASNDVIFALDCDEFIEELDADAVCRLISQNRDYILCTLKINRFERDSLMYNEHRRVSRIYDRRIYHFTGRIHEQLTRTDKKKPKYIDAPVTALHVGYDGTLEQRRKKAQRNAELLLMEIEQNGEDPYIRYQLGQAYYMSKEYEKAICEYEKSLMLKPDLSLEYVQDSIQSYCWCLINTKQYKKALDVFNNYDGLYNFNADFEFLAGSILMNNGMLSDSVIRFLKATECKNYKICGTNSFMSYYNIGVIFECSGQKDAAKEYYEKCGDYEPALKGLKRLG